MGLRKSHEKKESRIVRNSLFGVIDRAKSNDQMKEGEVNFPISLNFKAQKLARDAMLEAEYKKAYAIAFTLRMHFM